MPTVETRKNDLLSFLRIAEISYLTGVARANGFRRSHPLQGILRISMAALPLLLLGACALAPAKVSTLSPPGQAALRPTLQSTPPPVSIPAEIQPSPLPPAVETATTPPAVAKLPIALPTLEATPVATPLPDYYESSASDDAKRFEGRDTFTGERYVPDRMTAATRDFPLHSWLKVINPANGKEVNVRINDLTGKRKTPLVDLSRAAAKKLGFFGKGKIHVHVIPLLPTP
jgi:rare lipoprotein A (peptidoglycan hydrolase)